MDGTVHLISFFEKSFLREVFSYKILVFFEDLCVYLATQGMGKLSVSSNSKEVLELGNPYRKIWLLELMMVYYAKVVDK